MTTQLNNDTIQNSEPKLINLLPDKNHGYEYLNYKKFEGDFGYRLRFIKEHEDSHTADIYIWPVSKETLKYPHREIVLNLAEGALNDVYTVQETGRYSNVEVLDGKEYNNNGQVMAMYKLTMLRQNLNSISYIYVSEFGGKYLKLRISLPDNVVNRDRSDIEPFVLDLLNSIINNIESA
jgi:hypothetical protein